jgi:hypothetical protein
MNKRNKRILAYGLVFILLTSGLILMPGVSFATSPVSYVPIQLKNSQTTATPQNFSQLLIVNWSMYQSYLNSNVSNVRFYSSNSLTASSELYGWIETNNTTSATESHVWVNLTDNIIPASGTLTIYMAFLPLTSSWSIHWGLAPQLSSTYGKFDNGPHVFLYYSNFSGTTLTGWSTFGSFSGSTDNGETITSSSSWSGIYHKLSSSLLPNLTADYYGKYVSQQAFDIELSQTDTQNGMLEDGYGLHTNGVSGTTTDLIEWSASGGDTLTSGTISYSGSFYYGTIQEVSTGTVNTYVNEQKFLTASSTTYQGSEYVSLGGYGAGGINFFVQYARVRYTPPNGTMPTSTFGPVTLPTGYHISFNQISLPIGEDWGIRLSNASKVIWQNSTSEYDNFTGLNDGTYNYQVINATGYASNPYTGTLTINGANISQKITFTGYSITSTESGLPEGDTWFLNLSDQPGLSESDTGQHLSGSQTTISLELPNGTYTYTYQTSDHRYRGGTGSFTVSGSSYSFSVVFNPVLYYLNFTAISKPASLEWGVNVSGTIKTGYGDLLSFSLINGTYYWNASAINGAFDNPIGYYRLTNESGLVLLHSEPSFKGVKVVINGKNYNDNITFARAYNITFEEVGIANGFQWDVNLSNGLGATIDKDIIISNNLTQIYFNSTEGNYTNGTYAGSIQTIVYGLTGVRYANFSTSSLSETVAGQDTVYVYNYTTQYYLKTESVPSQGAASLEPGSGWYNALSSITLAARPNSGYEFTGWIGFNTSSYTGLGYYSSGEFLQSITLTNPITEEYTFNNFVPLTFYMQNLTSGAEWGIKLLEGSNLIQWANSTSYYIVFDLPIGNYSYIVTGLKSLPQSGEITLSTSLNVLLQYIITTFNVNFQEQGLPSNQNWGIKVFDSLFSVNGNTNGNIINFELPIGTYEYQANPITGYISNESSGSFTVSTSDLTIPVNWTEGNGYILLGVRYFVPLYINRTSILIPKGTQIPLNVNWSRYSVYENFNLSNVLFFNGSFNPLYAWIQSGANSTSKTSIVWVKTLSTYIINSSHIIYLGFLSKTRNDLNKYGYLGEEPQLSPVYGEYNNIAMVMDPGLVEQYYTNSSASFYSNTVIGGISASTIDAAGFDKGSYLTDGGIRFYANEPYFFSPQTNNANGTVYLGYSSSFQFGGGIITTTYDYKFYGIENNLLMDYQAGWGFVNYPGTWPSPPIVYTSYPQAWFVKYQGFVIQNQPQTIWYEIGDGSLSISNSTSYFNNWASSSPISLDPGGGSLGSTTSKIQGSAEFSMFFQQVPYVITSDTSAGFVTEWYGTRDLWQTWTNYPLSFYSPNPVLGLQNIVSKITFGVVSSSYSAFYEYGLPSNQNWSIAISGPGISHLFTSNSNLIYTYLPNGTYLYTIGSYVNGSYHSGIDGRYIPSPVSGHIIVTGAFTVQYIIFSLNQVLKYDLTPEQATGQGGNITLPILVINIQGLPAGLTTIDNVIKYLNATLISKNQNQTSLLTFTISQAKEGMIVLFLNISAKQIREVQNGSAVVSFVSGFQLGTIEEVAAGVAGSEIFSSVSANGPPGSNTTSKTGIGTINQIINELAYLESQAYGRALYLVLVLLAIMFYVLSISKHLKKKKNSKA